MTSRRRAVPLLVLLAGLAAAPADARVVARGSARQVQVTGARPGARLTLHRPGITITNRAGRLGGHVFRSVPPGRYTLNGQRVRVYSTRSAPLTTRSYRQTLKPGYGYLTTRDGTKLAVNVQLPGPPDKGPYPTLVEYSGYGYANPAGAQSGISPIAKLFGYAVVDVNMRGTGCSGGAFDYFERNQSLDGYDVVETVARQPWAKFHRVGMLGISYGGISQLFVGATRPPHLAAITPLSVIDNSATTLYPGGVLNTGFALNWSKERAHDARPASATGGQPWALKRIREGDRTCRSNQVLHANAIDLVAKVRANRFYVRSTADPVAPTTFVQKVRAPVFLACQWTDEQTGGHCPTLASRFTGTRRKWFTFTNGVHTDSLDPETFNRWFDFLELYVARRKPDLGPARSFAPTIYSTVFGTPGITLPPDPIQAQPDYASAKAAYERLKPVRILFDNGAGGSKPYEPVASWERSFSRWPVPGTRARSFFFDRGGVLGAARPRRGGSDAFTWKRTARPATSFVGDSGSGRNGLWTNSPSYRWRPSPAGTALSYVTPALRRSTTVIGAGSVQAWIESSSRYLDLQATVSEVRPDGKETFVQSGWLRTSARKLTRNSTLLTPIPTLRRGDAAPLPRGRFARVTIPLYYQGHAYRKGSRIRVVIAEPAGDQPIWAFAGAVPRRTARVVIARSPARPSRLVLPVVGGFSVPTALPPCPGLRGEPCRTYRRLINRAG